MSSNSFYNEQMLPYYSKPDGQKLYNSLTQAAMAAFPQYVEEIEGLANGAGLPFYKVLVTLIVCEVVVVRGMGVGIAVYWSEIYTDCHPLSSCGCLGDAVEHAD